MNLKNCYIELELNSGIKLRGVVLEDVNNNLIIDPVISGVSIPISSEEIEKIKAQLKLQNG